MIIIIDKESLYVSIKMRKRTFRIRDNVDASIQRLENDEIETRGKTNYSNQKQYRQLKPQQNKNKQKLKMGRKTTVRIFQGTNKWNLRWEDLDMIKKRES